MKQSFYFTEVFISPGRVNSLVLQTVSSAGALQHKHKNTERSSGPSRSPETCSRATALLFPSQSTKKRHLEKTELRLHDFMLWLQYVHKYTDEEPTNESVRGSRQSLALLMRL